MVIVWTANNGGVNKKKKTMKFWAAQQRAFARLLRLVSGRARVCVCVSVDRIWKRFSLNIYLDIYVYVCFNPWNKEDYRLKP